MAKGILLVAMDFNSVREDEFHDWYDLEHVPERERVPGFGACERWISTTDPKHAVASYELDNVDVLKSAPYQAIAGENLSVWSKRVTGKTKRLLRIEGEQITPGDQVWPSGCGGLLVNAMNIDPAHEEEFNKWYVEEHVPLLSAVPGTISGCRYRDVNGSPKYLALFHLESPEVTLTEAWQKAAWTPWTARMVPHIRDHSRFLTRRYLRGA